MKPSGRKVDAEKLEEIVHTTGDEPGVIGLAAGHTFGVKLELEAVLPVPDGTDAEVGPGARVTPVFIEGVETV